MKNIVIIGAGSGIGLELTRMLEKDHTIYALSRTSANLPESENIFWSRLDVMEDEWNLSSLPESIHGMVYCPGSINLKPVRGLKEEDVMDDFRLNALGAFRVVQKLLPGLKKAHSASLVFFSTIAVTQGMPYHASVAMAKGAIEGLGRSLAAELAPQVRVNVIAPSLTDTPLAARLLSSDERKQASAQRHPLKRVGEARDIARMAGFLLSDEASWITGQVLHVDGGMSNIKG